MPIHEYECRECKVVRDYLHAMDCDPTGCAACGAEGKLVRHLSVPRIGRSGKAPEVLEMGFLAHPEMGIIPAGVVREVRRDGDVCVDRTFVDLRDGKNLGTYRSINVLGSGV